MYTAKKVINKFKNVNRIQLKLYKIFFKAMIINPNQERFILAHEYGHLLFEQEKISDLIEMKINWNTTDPIEVWANQFAAEFLFPKKDVFQHSDKVNEAGLAFLMNEYGISRQVIVNRWFDFALIDQSQKKYFEDIKPIQLMKFYGYDNDEVRYYDDRNLNLANLNDFDKLPVDYLQLVKEAYITGKISYKKIADYSFLQPDEIEQKLGIKEEESDEFEYS